MEGPPNKKRLLFLNTDSRSFAARRHTRGKSVDSKVRRHVMFDIGMSRRKPSKTHQFDTIVWPLAETSVAVPSATHEEDSTTRHFDHSQVPANALVLSKTAVQYTSSALYSATALTLHALSVFEKEWGEDMFSAYGFTLIMVAGRNAMRSRKNSLIHRSSIDFNYHHHG